jgi:hypothetical protein
MKTRNFTIDPAYITSVTNHREWGMYDHIAPEDLTPEQLISIIQGRDRCSSISDHDHPMFAALRNQLEAQGYIQCQRSWWNGDSVLKPFRLNGVLFQRHEQFVCGAAMAHYLKYKEKVA